MAGGGAFEVRTGFRRFGFESLNSEDFMEKRQHLSHCEVCLWWFRLASNLKLVGAWTYLKMQNSSPVCVLCRNRHTPSGSDFKRSTALSLLPIVYASCRMLRFFTPGLTADGSEISGSFVSDNVGVPPLLRGCGFCH